MHAAGFQPDSAAAALEADAILSLDGYEYEAHAVSETDLLSQRPARKKAEFKPMVPVAG